MGSGQKSLTRMHVKAGFQSSLPAWGAAQHFANYSEFFWISILAPRMGSGVGADEGNPDPIYFNPRSPHGERRQ